MNDDIYKIVYISNKKIDNQQIPEKIIVFYGKIDLENEKSLNINAEELKNLFDSDMNNPKFNNIFSDQELENIKTYNIPVFFSLDRIYGDDTIETIKKKIIKNFNYEFSFEEIYLFAKHGIKVSASQLYNKLTNNGTLSLTYQRLQHFLINIHKASNDECELIIENSFENLKSKEEKNDYSFDDIVELFFTKKETIQTVIPEEEQEEQEEHELISQLDTINLFMDIPIGQKLIYKKSDYLYIVNPFNVDEYDDILINNAKNLISTSNKSLLLNNSPIICNTIFLCTASNVLEYIQSENEEKKENNEDEISSEITMQIYFPYCAEKNIFSLTDLQSNTQELIDDSKKMINNIYFNRENDNVDLFYNIYYERINGIDDLKYVHKGISHVNIELKPETDFTIPLDIIFKLLHANKDVPLIKYNPSSRQEKIYRLYANKISENGKKIPFLPLSTINKIMDEVKTDKRVSVYIEYTYDSKIQDENCPIEEKVLPIICEFDNHGHIFIYLTLKDAMNDEYIEIIIKESVNPIISIVKLFLEQNGYTIDLFTSLYDSNVIIRELKYEAALELPKDFSIDLKGNMSCITSLFNIIDYKEKKRFILRYKRVSNYNEMEGQDAYIIEQFLKSSFDSDVVNGLMQNFHISKEQAEERVEQLFNSLQIKRDKNKNARIKINSHPGFKTSVIQLSRHSRCGETFKVEVENIDNIYYLSHIEKLIDAFIRLLNYNPQKINTNVSKENIDKQCKTKPIKETTEISGVKDFVIHGNISSLESNPVTIEAESLEFPEEVNEEELITDLGLESILFGDFSEGEEEEQSQELGEIESETYSDMEGGSSDSEGSQGSQGSDISYGEIEKMMENIDLGDVEVQEPQKISPTTISPLSDISGLSSLSDISNVDLGDVEVEEESKKEKTPSSSSKISSTSTISNVGEELENIDLGDVELEEEIQKDKTPSPEKIPSISPLKITTETKEPSIIPPIPQLTSLSEKEKQPSLKIKKSSLLKLPEDIKIISPPKETTSEISKKQELSQIPSIQPSSSTSPSQSKKKISKPKSLKKLPENVIILPEEVESNIVPQNIPQIIPQIIPQKETEGKMIRDITGEKLANPNPFFERLINRDPLLYRSRGDGKMNQYSRSCPWNYRKQPVILTDKEKEEIDKNHPGSYDKAIKYGSNPMKKYWYICPRFWDLKNNVSLTEQQVNELKKKEGDVVIPYDAKEVPPGKYIFEFTEDKYHIDKKTGNYINHNPGFQSTEDGLCIPCCFNNNKFNKEQQTNARKDCGCEDDKGDTKKKDYTCEGAHKKEILKTKTNVQELPPPPQIPIPSKIKETIMEKPDEKTKEVEINIPEPIEEEERIPIQEEIIETKKTQKYQPTDFFIFGPERKLQLKDGKWGYMNMALQLFFNQDNRKCYISPTNTGLTQNQMCLLQRGVENNENQSFIACIADIYNNMNEIQQNKKLVKPTVNEMKNIIINALHLDNFMTFQNGNLIDIFSKKIESDEYDLENKVGGAFEETNPQKEFTQEENIAESGYESESSIPLVGEEDKWFKEQPIQEEPIEEQPIEEQPIEEQPMQEQPMQEQPIEEQPIEEEINIEIKESEKQSEKESQKEKQVNDDITEIKRLKELDDDMFKQTIMQKYSNTKIYKSIKNMSNTNPDYLFFKKLVLSYENFINFLQSDYTIIDHTHLWDIVTKPNPKLFPNGINLIILEVPKKDITNDIDIICPTNHYSKSFFDDKKQSAIIIKKGNYFEPIYQVFESNKQRIKTNLFSQEGIKLMPILQTTINNIKKIFDNYCKPMNSIPKIGSSNISSQFPKLYEFENNIGLDSLLSTLKKYNFIILNQILNFDGKVIGLYTKKIDEITNKSYEGIIMSNPSSINESIENIHYIDDNTLWKSYEDTIQFLKYVYTKTKIPCRPNFKIIDDGKIVGIITETNQFIPVSIDSSIIIPNDGIPIMNDFDFNIADIETYTRLKEDPQREKYVKYLYLENNFYNVFRNTVRILLNKYENNYIKNEIQELIKSKENDDLYLDKLTILQEKISTLIKEYILFDDDYYNEEILMQLSDITTSCLTELNSCNSNSKNKKKFCLKETSDDGNCRLVIPKKNLIQNNYDNEIMYIAKLSDELIRYNRIRGYMFDRKIFLSFSNIGYNLRDDEMIILESMLTQDYFKDLVPIVKSEYVDFNTFDTANPLLTELYSNVYDSSIGKIKQNICKTIKKSFPTNIKDYYFGDLLPSTFNTLYFENITSTCSFDIFIYILKNEANRQGREEFNDITFSDIKNILSNLYSDYISKNPSKINQIINVIKYYGMELIYNELNKDKTLIDKFVFLDNYNLTRLDIWMLSLYYKIPIILLSSLNKLLPETLNKFPLLTTYSLSKESSDIIFEIEEPQNDLNNGYYIIISPPIKQNIITNYSLIHNNNEPFISYSIFTDKFKEFVTKEEAYFDNENIEKKGDVIEKPYFNFINKVKLQQSTSSIIEPSQIPIPIVNKELSTIKENPMESELQIQTQNQPPSLQQPIQITSKKIKKIPPPLPKNIIITETYNPALESIPIDDELYKKEIQKEADEEELKEQLEAEEISEPLK
jgi:hypothetical protein